MEKEYINNILKYIKNVLDLERYNHSISVASICVNMATIYNENQNDAFLMGLLHDVAKNIPLSTQIEMLKKYNLQLNNDDLKSPKVLHSYLGAYISKSEFNINDNIFLSIYTHTLGDINMNNLQKILFIADYIDPLREELPNIYSIRKMALNDMNMCIFNICKNTIEHLNEQNVFIHKKTIEVYEYYKNIIS